VKLFRKLKAFPSHLRGGALAIGNFDGVHRGHARLINRLIEHSKLADGPSIVFTFDPHPVRILNRAAAPPPLTWTDRKAELLGLLGVDVVIAYPTNRELLELTCHEFFEEIVVQKIAAAAMVEGPNFFFGKDRGGDIRRLAELCDASSINLEIVQPVEDADQLVSSSRIRTLIAEGDVGKAAEMLTQPYRLRGMVTHGAGRGNDLGFPTANLAAVDTQVPNMGVYAGRAVVDGTRRWAAIHVGPSPTFGDESKIEVHILDFESSIYGQTIEVEFIESIRDARKFESVEELQLQLSKDIELTRRIANIYSTKAS